MGTPGEDREQEFSCPRCGGQVHERFYGPCADCRSDLTRMYARSSSESAGDETAATGRFEPAMHVVPNHVATKD